MQQPPFALRRGEDSTYITSSCSACAAMDYIKAKKIIMSTIKKDCSKIFGQETAVGLLPLSIISALNQIF